MYGYRTVAGFEKEFSSVIEGIITIATQAGIEGVWDFSCHDKLFTQEDSHVAFEELASILV